MAGPDPRILGGGPPGGGSIVRIRAACLAALFALGLWAQDTRVVLVRHGEKASEEDKDSGLSGTGRRRAEALVGELLPLAPQVLYATARKRTQQTLAPLAQRTGLAIQARPPADSPGTAREILDKQQGKVVVVCGHSNTLAGLAAGLGFKGKFPEVTGYDLYWIVEISAGSEPRLQERTMAFVP